MQQYSLSFYSSFQSSHIGNWFFTTGYNLSVGHLSLWMDNICGRMGTVLACKKVIQLYADAFIIYLCTKPCNPVPHPSPFPPFLLSSPPPFLPSFSCSPPRFTPTASLSSGYYFPQWYYMAAGPVIWLTMLLRTCLMLPKHYGLIPAVIVSSSVANLIVIQHLKKKKKKREKKQYNTLSNQSEHVSCHHHICPWGEHAHLDCSFACCGKAPVQ